jgi:hypothetical protein
MAIGYQCVQSAQIANDTATLREGSWLKLYCPSMECSKIHNIIQRKREGGKGNKIHYHETRS